MKNKCLQVLALVTVVAALSSCAVMESSPVPALSGRSGWVVLPMENHTETPQAGQRAAALAEALLSARGLTGVERYPADDADETLFDPARSDLRQKALDWARARHARYALTGSVIEWRYKVGVDGEPAVGMTLQLIDVESAQVIWSATGSRTGWSRDALSSTATRLEQQLLAPLVP
jgi:TolB-like protein